MSVLWELSFLFIIFSIIYLPFFVAISFIAFKYDKSLHFLVIIFSFICVYTSIQPSQFSLIFWFPFGIFIIFFYTLFLIVISKQLRQKNIRNKQFVAREKLSKIISSLKGMHPKQDLDLYETKKNKYLALCQSNLKVWNYYFKKFSFQPTVWILTSIFISFIILSGYWVLSYFHNTEIWSLLQTTIYQPDLITKLNISKEELDESLLLLKEKVIYFPILIFFINGVFFFVSLLILKFLYKVLILKNNNAPSSNLFFPLDIVFFYINEHFIFIFLLFFLSLLLGMQLQINWLFNTSINLVIISCFIYILQGISIIKLYLEVRLLSTKLILSLLILISLISIYSMLICLLIFFTLGLLDFYFNFKNKILQYTFD